MRKARGLHSFSFSPFINQVIQSIKAILAFTHWSSCATYIMFKRLTLRRKSALPCGGKQWGTCTHSVRTQDMPLDRRYKGLSCGFFLVNPLTSSNARRWPVCFVTEILARGSALRPTWCGLSLAKVSSVKKTIWTLEYLLIVLDWAADSISVLFNLRARRAVRKSVPKY